MLLAHLAIEQTAPSDASAHWAAAAALAATITAVVAIVALIQAARDSAARSRPMVIAEFRIAENSDSTVDLVVRNAGPSLARGVSVRFDPTFAIPDDSERYFATYLLERYQHPIPVLTPGQELTNIWWAGREASTNRLENREPTPDKVTVTITYRGDRRQRKPYCEKIPLDVATTLNMTYSISSTSFPGRMKSITQHLGEIREALKRIAANDRS